MSANQEGLNNQKVEFPPLKEIKFKMRSHRTISVKLESSEARVGQFRSRTYIVLDEWNEVTWFSPNIHHSNTRDTATRQAPKVKREFAKKSSIAQLDSKISCTTQREEPIAK